MPDLHKDAVHAFWDSYDRRTLYRVIVSLERVESWALDEEPDLEPAVLELGRALDMATDFDVDGYEEAIVRILACTHSSRAMRILQSMDIAKPGSAGKLLMWAEDRKASPGAGGGSPFANLFLTRNLVFERMQLLSRVFSPQRVAIVLKALEKMG